MRQTIETPEQLLDAIAEEAERAAYEGEERAAECSDRTVWYALVSSPADLEIEVETARGTVYVSGTLLANYAVTNEPDTRWTPGYSECALDSYEEIDSLEVEADDPTLLADWDIDPDRVAERIMRD